MQAVQVTTVCSKLKHVGLELRTRPFMYSQVQQLELDSFLLYTSSITMDVGQSVDLLHLTLILYFLVLKGTSCAYSYEATLRLTCGICSRCYLECIF